MRKKVFGMGKKGSIIDSITWLILAFVLVIVCGLFVFVGNKIETELMSSAPTIQPSLSNGTNFTELVRDNIGGINRAYSSLSWICVVLIVGMIFSILISNYLVTVHPVFFVIFILIAVIGIIVSAPISNTYETLRADATIGSTFDSWTGVNFIFDNLPVWFTIITILSGIVMCVNMSKSYGRGGGYY